MAAIVARPFGLHWLALQGTSGGSVEVGLAWLEPFANGARQHVEFVNTQVRFDRERAEAGVDGFGGLWDPAEAATLYWLASRLDQRWFPLARRLAPAPPDWLGLCQSP